jgi:hypothetical protein
MKKIKITKEHGCKIAKYGCGMLLRGAKLALAYWSIKNASEFKYYIGDVKYSDAVSVIMDSGMYSSDKTRAVEMLKKDGDSEFYKSIIKVVNSNMFSSDKLKLITTMCKETEGA